MLLANLPWETQFGEIDLINVAQSIPRAPELFQHGGRIESLFEWRVR